MEHYMDNSTTSVMDEEVVMAMQGFLEESYGNPDEEHFLGEESKEAVDMARRTIADRIGNYPENIYFTSGETEGNNWIIKCFNGEKKRILVSSIEHNSIIKSAETKSCTLIKVNKDGKINLKHLEEELKKGDVGLVSVEMANGEIGIIQPVEEIAKLVHRYGALYHCSGTHAFGKMRFDVDELDVDFMTLSAHRMHGPKGIGAVYIKEGLSLEPLLHGDMKERGLRAGSLNVPAIVGFGKAVEVCFRFLDNELSRQRKLTERIFMIFKQHCSKTEVNGNYEDRLPGIINLNLHGKNCLDVMYNDYNSKNIIFSGGIKKENKDINESHVIKALGKNPENSIRFSISRFNGNFDCPDAAMKICSILYNSK